MAVLIKSKEVIATEENGVIVVKPRIIAPLIILFFGLAAAVALFLLAFALAGPLPDYSRFAAWGGAVLAGMSLLMLAAAVCVCFFRKTTIDAIDGCITKGRIRHAFQDIDDIVVRSKTIMDQEILTVVAIKEGKDILLVSGHSPKHRDALQETAERMKALAAPGNTVQGKQRASSDASAPARGRLFVGAVMIALGAVLSTSAGLMIPDLVLTRPRLSFGFLFWPIGIWVAAAGVLDLIGISIMHPRRLRGGGALRTALAVVWLVSYFTICYRPV